jgi:hypothetical protein
LLYLFILALLSFLFIVVSMIVYHQRDGLRKNTYRDIKADLNLMADASREALVKSDYVFVRNAIRQWGEKRKEFVELRFVAPNGFVIAEYKNPESTAGETYSLTKEVTIDQYRLATIYLKGNYYEADTLTTEIRNQLAFAGLLITVLLGAVLWLIFRNMAIAPLEAAVNKRTQALLESNRELEQLMNNSPS